MKIFFLNPPFHPNFSRCERSPQVSKSGTLYFPVWLAQAAAFIESNGYDISLCDAVASKMSIDDILKWIKNGKPDIIVIEVSTPSISNDLKVASQIKGSFPSLSVVLVGPHATACADDILKKNSCIDFIIRGEYELPLLSLCNAIKTKSSLLQVKGLSYTHKDGTIMSTDDSPLLDNIDLIPFTSTVYHRFLDYKSYYFAAAQWPGFMLMTGRGCPNRCVWCLFNQTLHGRKYRFRSPQSIISELQFCIETFDDLREIWFDDDTFTANKEHLREVCTLIIEKKLKFQKHPFRWYCNARPPLDLHTMKLMKKAGCRLIVTGFESGDPEILYNMKKGFSLPDGFTFINNARKAGLLVHGCFVVGNKGETEQTMLRTLYYAKNLRPDSAQFYFIHPYPGTEYYEWAEQNNYLTTPNFDEWLDSSGKHRCVISFPHLSAAQMTAFCEKAYRSFHFDGRYIAGKMTQLIMNPAEGFRSLKAGFNYLYSLLNRTDIQHE